MCGLQSKYNKYYVYNSTTKMQTPTNPKMSEELKGKFRELSAKLLERLPIEYQDIMNEINFSSSGNLNKN